ncbi:MAG: YdcH family protein [Hyphomicrobiaceae bacterium]
MALDAHLDELVSKHKKLELKIEKAMAQPSVDQIEVTKLKREKLRLKDQISRLGS